MWCCISSRCSYALTQEVGRVLGKVLRGGKESAFGVLGGGETEWDWDFCEERGEAVGF